jgi:hypothetical protein
MEENEGIRLIRRISHIIVFLVALGVPLTLLPLQGHWGFERSVLLLVVFLGLVGWRLVTNVVATHGSPKEKAGHAPQLQRVALLAGAALPVAALLAADNPDVRYLLLTNLEMWAAVGGVLVAVVLPLGGAGRTVVATHASPKEGAGHGPQLPVLALGVLLAAALLISPTSVAEQSSLRGAAGPIKQGLDYRTSLTITSKTLQASPLWGAGPGRFGESFLRYKPVEFNQRPDWMLRYNGSQSGLLEFATEYGLIGLIGPIGLIGVVLADLQRKREAGGGLEFYLLSGLLGVVIAAFALLPYSPGVFWGLGFLSYLGGGRDEV